MITTVPSKALELSNVELSNTPTEIRGDQNEIKCTQSEMNRRSSGDCTEATAKRAAIARLIACWNTRHEPASLVSIRPMITRNLWCEHRGTSPLVFVDVRVERDAVADGIGGYFLNGGRKRVLRLAALHLKGIVIMRAVDNVLVPQPSGVGTSIGSSVVHAYRLGCGCSRGRL